MAPQDRNRPGGTLRRLPGARGFPDEVGGLAFRKRLYNRHQKIPQGSYDLLKVFGCVIQSALANERGPLSPFFGAFNKLVRHADGTPSQFALPLGKGFAQGFSQGLAAEIELISHEPYIIKVLHPTVEHPRGRNPCRRARPAVGRPFEPWPSDSRWYLACARAGQYLASPEIEAFSTQ